MFKNWFHREQAFEQSNTQNHSGGQNAAKVANAFDQAAQKNSSASIDQTNFASNYEFNQKLRLEQARYRILGLIILSVVLILLLPFIIKKPSQNIKPRIEIQNFSTNATKNNISIANETTERKSRENNRANDTNSSDNNASNDSSMNNTRSKQNNSSDAPLPKKSSSTNMLLDDLPTAKNPQTAASPPIRVVKSSEKSNENADEKFSQREAKKLSPEEQGAAP
jgi:sensor c-di-GMP phosphodiesterase-like protein